MDEEDCEKNKAVNSTKAKEIGFQESVCKAKDKIDYATSYEHSEIYGG